MVGYFTSSVVYGFILVILFMAILWLLHIPIKNAALVDVGWSFSIPLLAALYYSFLPEKKLYHHLLLAMVCLWGLRLGLYLFFTRIYKATEEGRYQTLRQNWKNKILLKFFLFYELQAILALWLSLPFWLSFSKPNMEITALEILAVILFSVGFLGESLADLQLYLFKKNPANKGKIFRQGLWKYSRHPNYFFEIIIWISYALYSLRLPWGFLAILAPLTMIFFILRVTGIPATEEQNLRSKGEEYRHYQKTTSRLIPWFPKKTL